MSSSAAAGGRKGAAAVEDPNVAKYNLVRLGFEGLGVRGASLMRNCPPLGPYSRHMPRALWWP